MDIVSFGTQSGGMTVGALDVLEVLGTEELPRAFREEGGHILDAVRPVLDARFSLIRHSCYDVVHVVEEIHVPP